MTILAYTDGAARGNPGESGIGVVFKDEKGAIVTKLCGYIGEATNNVAEYQALIACIKNAPKTKCSRLVVHSDSELMVRQLLGEYKVKDPNLKLMFQKVQRLLAKAPFEFEIKHVGRELNKEADQLANLGIDSRKPIRV
ncbi:MAG: ribonuclease HI family protein [Ignavibacteriales bacterium]|nr:ribonuclease HI family protein [Ignavibacteriales bacterium]